MGFFCSWVYNYLNVLQKLLLIMEANMIDPDQAAPLRAVAVLSVRFVLFAKMASKEYKQIR